MQFGEDGSDQPDGGRPRRRVPTTRDRRLISLLMRSRGLVDQIVCQWAVGNAAKARTSARAGSTSGPALGKLAASWSRTWSQAVFTASASGCAKTVLGCSPPPLVPSACDCQDRKARSYKLSAIAVVVEVGEDGSAESREP